MLEPIMQSVPDPFDAYGSSKSESEIFSILPPLAILSNPMSSTRDHSPSPPTINGHEIDKGNLITNGSLYPSNHTSSSLGSQSWQEEAAKWSNARSISPSSSTSSLVRYSNAVGSSPRRPSSPPSTGTLRKSSGKPRLSLAAAEGLLSTDTSKDVDGAIFKRKEPSRQDTLTAKWPPRSMPDGDEIRDETIRIMPEGGDPGPVPPVPKKSGFASTFSRIINPSSTAGGSEKA